MLRTHAWNAPEIPELTGEPAPVRLYDSASESVRPLELERDQLRLYVCGITPYDATHLGHAATYLAFDSLNRAARQWGKTVEYSQNVTDVDDPLFERANATNVDWRELAASQTDLFRSDMTALRVIPPDNYVRVQDVIDDIASAVETLCNQGFAYRVPTPDATGEDIYLDLAAVQNETLFKLGSVSHYSPEALAEQFVEFGGDPDRPGKRCPFDPLLWRAAREGEPAWPAAVGEGRPGWHVECAVIAQDTLGPTIDVQAGGKDLRFPHHEMTAAHAAALSREPFAHHFAHAGLVAYEGTKMSKSLGNLVLVSKLVAEGHEAAAVRLAVLAHHYREDWEWDEAGLDQAETRLASWRAAASRAEIVAGGDDQVTAMRAALANDLDTPALIRLVDEWSAARTPATQVVAAVDALLGVTLI